MAFPTLSSFTYEEPYVIVFKVGGSSGTVISQLQKISGKTQATRPKKTLRRIGDQTAYTARGAAEYESTCNAVFFSSDDQSDFLTALGISSGNGLDATQALTLTVEVYDSDDATTATLLFHRELTNAHPVLDQFDIGADDDAMKDTISWESDDKWTTTVP